MYDVYILIFSVNVIVEFWH